ncbi:hypothetical protein J7K50_08175 [bacterium]|nr:hypothetical protein [bacterium]
MKEEKRNYRYGVVGLARGLVWLVVGLWVIITAVIGLINDASLEQLFFAIFLGALVLFIAASLVASIGVNLVVSSIIAIRRRRKDILRKELEQIIAAQAEDKSKSEEAAERERRLRAGSEERFGGSAE